MSEIKGKLNLGKNPWYIDIPLNIIVGIPLTIIGGLFWLIGNGFVYVFVKPFEQEKTWEDLKWAEFEKLENLTLEKSEPINNFLDKKEQKWFEEDPVYALRTSRDQNPLNGKIFSDFKIIFDGKIFLQELTSTDKREDIEFKSRLISIEPEHLKIETIKEFDYYYLKAVSDTNGLHITGTDQAGTKLEMKIENTLANNA